MKIQYLTLQHVMAIHDTMIEEFGGSYGIRDEGLLDSAINQPRQTFGGVDLYPTLFDKASVYAFQISENQPFIDGNKRTAAGTAAVFLSINGYELECPEGQVYETIMKLANKKLSREEFAKWLKDNCAEQDSF